MTGPTPSRRKPKPLAVPLTALQEFLKLESAGGIILVAMMVVALVLVNSPAASVYDAFLNLPVEIRFGPLDIAKPLLLWINDGLMVLFFLHVTLEIKREILAGELSSPKKLALPAFAALGGMMVPALIYLAFNIGNAEAVRGWAIPSATDIAFSLGILSLLGRRVPISLKIFLAALAILDDLGAIVIIALFYTENLSWLSLGLAGLGTALLFGLNRAGVLRLVPYVIVALFLWVCVLKSGVHATLAGVALGFAIPLRVPGPPEEAPARRLEHDLLPTVAYVILPLFALTNSGLALSGIGAATFQDGVFLGIAIGLFLGKQIGVFAFAWIAVRLGLAKLPARASWSQLYGVAILTGIGFTMSLFIGSLAFSSTGSAATRFGVLAGSSLSALVGYLVLLVLSRRRTEAEESADSRAVRDQPEALSSEGNHGVRSR